MSIIESVLEIYKFDLDNIGTIVANSIHNCIDPREEKGIRDTYLLVSTELLSTIRKLEEQLKNQ